MVEISSKSKADASAIPAAAAGPAVSREIALTAADNVAERDAAARARHVAGLDSLRFVAAMWVVFSHVGDPPLFHALGRDDAWAFVLTAAWGILFSGPAAVIVFFVISGFCIHYPYALARDLEVVPYLVRRYVRIGIPMGTAMGLAAIAGMDRDYYVHGILWSLVAELIYYTLYPAIRWFKARAGIDSLIAATFIAALFVPLAAPGIQGYAVFGWQLNWILGLPCWLLGVKLADSWIGGTTVADSSAAQAWKWRLYAWAASSFCLTLNYHSPVSYAWTLNVFAFVAFAWIEREILRAAASGASRWLERVGRWSYSLYLCHMPATTAYRALNVRAHLDPLSDWAVKMTFVLASAYVFYRAVEWPSHQLARWLARRAQAR